MTTVAADLERRVAECVREVAGRLQDPELVKSIMIHEQAPYLEAGRLLIPMWSDLSLAGGYPGLCVLFGALDGLEPEQGWDRIGHGHLVAVQQALSEQAIGDTGAFGGLTGIAWGAAALSRGGTRYQNMVAKLNATLAAMAAQEMEQLQAVPAGDAGPRHYDAIGGVSGVARYLLLYREQPEVASLLQEMLAFLVKITEPRRHGEEEVPGWLVKPEAMTREADRSMFPNGYYDFGLSHGITGPFVVLSLALRDGVEVPGQREAVRRVAEWLLGWYKHDAPGQPWMTRISLEEERERVADKSPGNDRDSWCYGAMGIGRALWLAGQALGEPDWCERAVEAYRNSCRLLIGGGIAHEAPTFCHGLGGLLHMTQEMLRDTGHPELAAGRDWLAEQVLATFDPSLPFGFADLDAPDISKRPTNKAGLLEGAAGTAFALASCLSAEEMPGTKLFFLR